MHSEIFGNIVVNIKIIIIIINTKESENIWDVFDKIPKKLIIFY